MPGFIYTDTIITTITVPSSSSFIDYAMLGPFYSLQGYVGPSILHGHPMFHRLRGMHVKIFFGIQLSSIHKM
jgi:hypothetical protein